jgi:chemotaxis protein CheC
VTKQYSELQLDALRELANIGSGTAATALASMLGRTVDVNVPNVHAMSLADAVDAAGPPEQYVTGVILPVEGDIEAIVLMIFSLDGADTLCRLLGVDPATEIGRSALGEIGNILGTSYIGALGMMTGLAFDPCPPETATDMLAAIVASVLVPTAGTSDIALLLDTDLAIEGAECSFSFMFVPTADGTDEVLLRLGLGDVGPA